MSHRFRLDIKISLLTIQCFYFYKWTPVVSLLVTNKLFSLDALSDELQRPFDNLDNTLPINSIANIIERGICAALD